jgi:hypothetical protein
VHYTYSPPPIQSPLHSREAPVVSGFWRSGLLHLPLKSHSGMGLSLGPEPSTDESCQRPVRLWSSLFLRSPMNWLVKPMLEKCCQRVNMSGRKRKTAWQRGKSKDRNNGGQGRKMWGGNKWNPHNADYSASYTLVLKRLCVHICSADVYERSRNLVMWDKIPSL